MSTLEDRLREAFRADGETVRPETIPGPPERPMRRALGRPRLRRPRLLIPLAAAAAVVAIGAGLSLATPLFHGSGHPSVTGPTANSLPSGPVPTPTLAANASRGVTASTPAPGVPRFYVTSYFAPSGGANYLVVRNTATGRVVARIDPPAGDNFAAIAAPTGDRTFVTALGPNSGCSSQLYQFRLNDQGQPGALAPLHVTIPGIYSETGDLAITPDGRTIGYAAYDCNGTGAVGVINLATRQVRVWRYTAPGTPLSLSLSADGRWLGYIMFPEQATSVNGAKLSKGAVVPGGARILRTSAAAGSLLQRSRLVSRTARWATLTSDGASLYYCAVSPYHGGALPNAGTLTYGMMPVAGGAGRVIASWTSIPYPQCWASLGTAGNYLLVQFPTATDWVRPAILDLRTGRLTDINAPAFYGPSDIAW